MAWSDFKPKNPGLLKLKLAGIEELFEKAQNTGGCMSTYQKAVTLIEVMKILLVLLLWLQIYLFIAHPH